MKNIINKIGIIAFIVLAMSSCKKCDYNQNNCTTCPTGFVRNIVNDNCEQISSQTAVLQGQQFVVEKIDSSQYYSEDGASFYNLYDTTNYPINSSGNTLIDANNNPIIVNNTKPGAPWLGRLNNVGVWSSAVGNSEWIGFSTCIEVEQKTKVCIGVGGDNRVRFSITPSSVSPLPLIELSSTATYNFQTWHVFEFELQAGVNIITVDGWNDPSSAAGFGAEIYRGNLATVSSWVSDAEINDALIFSTKDLIGSKFQTGNINGFTCPNGGTIDFCTGDTIPVCTSILREPYLPCQDIVLN